MDVSLYSAAAAMNATERWQDLVADNLSSASVPGARGQEISFSAVQAGLASGTPGAAGSSFDIPSAGSTINFQQGELKATGGDMDLALEGPGFFSVQMPDGCTAYTRDGEFKLNNQGQRISKQGYPVVSDGGALTFDPNNTAPISISRKARSARGRISKGKLP